jgi:hypothetical protein
MVGLQRVSCAFLNISYSENRQLIVEVSLPELPKRVQVSDFFVGFLQGRDVELVAVDYVSYIAESFANYGFTV